MNGQYLTGIKELSGKILAGGSFFVAGDEDLLRQLPRGNWAGGTIPYFMAEQGGVFTREKIAVFELPSFVVHTHIKTYDSTTLPGIYTDAPDNGFSLIVMPASSPTHLFFALNAPRFQNFATRPLIGWVSGVPVSDVGKTVPTVFDGSAGTSFEDAAIVMHVSLPKDKTADVGIINIFEQGGGDTLTFSQDCFSAVEVFVNGKKTRFATYLKEHNIDIKLPLVANYNGIMINTSFQRIDELTGTVYFYAPLFRGIKYKHARPIGDYVAAFTSQLPPGHDTHVFFSCNCILNYQYAGLEGKKTAGFTGPITFGEIAYQLLNQTMVYLRISEINLAQRLSAEAVLKERFYFLETLLETIPNPVFYKDTRGIYTGCNKAFEEYLGLSREEIIGKTVYDIAPKEIADMYYQKDEELFKTRTKQIYEWKVKDKAGNLKYVIFYKAALNDTRGRLAGLVGVISDISGLIKAEQSIKESWQRLSDIINFLPEATFVIDTNGTVIIWNKAIEEMTGVKAGDIVGKGDCSYALPFYGKKRQLLIDVIGQPFDEIQKMYPGATKENDAIFMETLLPDFRGKNAWMFVKAAPLYNTKGEIVGAIENIRDITEIKRAQERLTKAYNDLHETQDQLLQSQKMSAVGQLAGGVAHEINNPLSVIYGFSQSLVNQVDENDKLYMPLKSIEREAIRCKNLVRDLLTFSRTTTVGASVEDTDINALLKTTLQLVATRTNTSGVELNKEFGQHLPLLKINGNMIQQVVINICNNAIDAMPDGGILTVTTRLAQERTGFVEISITDTGRGIPADIQGKVFEPFFTTKEIGKGTGLGLALAYEIIQQHHGFIECTSTPGEGTIFSLYLPV